ncbi:hypothetical protein KM043_011314 [Ampulex compressa]|nr:hypothetical protein KM043_011314 [Ampulex compressa]
MGKVCWMKERVERRSKSTDCVNSLCKQRKLKAWAGQEDKEGSSGPRLGLEAYGGYYDNAAVGQRTRIIGRQVELGWMKQPIVATTPKSADEIVRENKPNGR